MQRGDIVKLIMPDSDGAGGVPQVAWRKYVGKKLIIDTVTPDGPRLSIFEPRKRIMDYKGYQWWWPREFVVKYQPKNVKKVLSWK